MWLWGKFCNLRYLLFMDKRLLEEISRQKELMMVNEQLAQTVFGGLKDAMGQAIVKSFLDATLGDEEVETPSDEIKTSDTILPSSKQTNFDELVSKVIDNFEGGYYHPVMEKDGRHPGGVMGDSGETMMGMDRKHGKGFAQTTAGQEFWKLIDDSGAKNNWKWNYMGGPLESKLRKLVSQQIKPVYDDLSNRYLKPKAREIVKNNPDLTFHFIYATWNGPGWFQKFAKKINDAVDNGITNPTELGKIAMKSRKESGNSIIARGGEKMTKLLGIKNV